MITKDLEKNAIVSVRADLASQTKSRDLSNVDSAIIVDIEDDEADEVFINEEPDFSNEAATPVSFVETYLHKMPRNISTGRVTDPGLHGSYKECLVYGINQHFKCKEEEYHKNKIVNVAGSDVRLQIWDTAGQERFRSITHAYYRDAHALLLLYEIGNRRTFENTRAWLCEIYEYADSSICILLIGNKCDSTVREVTTEEGEQLASEYGIEFVETSAKTGQNVEAAFNIISRILLEATKNGGSSMKRVETEHLQNVRPNCTCNVG
ncbi:ras-related protein Rab-26-like isoform X2 [Artemia franciscana]|uniref:ras-related protein Rab-26-like isoform X2 n=1 Tax=Artemia franciscana TaxID=6661 RepID=UPI0032DA78C2